MASDLISHSALLAEYDRVHVGELGGARKLIAEAPAVDAVEVVRCRDCRMYRPESVFFPAYCTVSGQQKTDDDFCSWGERMEEDAVD